MNGACRLAMIDPGREYDHARRSDAIVIGNELGARLNQCPEHAKLKAVNHKIEIDPRRCNGKPVIAGTRIPVTVVLDQLAESGSADDVLRKYPELSRETIAAALRYCHSVIERTDFETRPA